MNEVVQIDPWDDDAFDEWFDVLNATDLERWPGRPGWQHSERLASARNEKGPEIHRFLVARYGDGPVIGIADLETYRHENAHLARLDVRVLPSERRRGVGTAIVMAANALAQQEGRRELAGMDEAPIRSDYRNAAGPFARSLGFAAAQRMARREIALPLPADRAKALWADPKSTPQGYTMLTFLDRWPDEFLEDRCELGRRMSTDAPSGDQDLDEEVWDAARVRQIEGTLVAMNRGKVSTAARHEVSGRLVGFTEVAVPLGAPESAWQQDTLVLGEHRGHGLGFAMKLANIEAVKLTHPGVRRINTWNAVENEPMIAVNEAMGFELTATSNYWLRRIETD
jgi:RimJ/RimL family protein N-acetyltransferase